MNSFNSMKNGSGVINQIIKELQYNKTLQNIYIHGAYYSNNSELRLYNKNGTEFLPTLGRSGGNGDVFIAKYTINGTVVWRTRIGGQGNNGYETAVNMISDSSNNIYISGTYGTGPIVYNKNDSAFTTLINGLGTAIYIVKYNSNGMGEWSTRIDNEGEVFVKNMIMDSSNNIYISGWMTSGNNEAPKFYNSTGTDYKTISRQNMSSDMFISKYDNSGNVLWVAKIGGTDAYNGGGGYQPVTMLLDSSNNIYISGRLTVQYCGPVTFYNSTDTTTSTFKQLSSSTGYDTFVAKYNNDGIGIWAALIGNNTDIIYSSNPVNMKLDSANNVYISGFYFGDLTLYNSNDTSFATLTNVGSSDIFIAKYYSNGSCAWATNMVSPSDDRPVDMTLDSSNNVYVTGYYNANLTLYNSNISTAANFKTLTNDVGTNTFIAKYNRDGSGVWAMRIGGIGKPNLSTVGNTWSPKDTSREWRRVSVSSDGMYQTAIEYGYIYKSSDYGDNWSATATNYGINEWYGISVSWNGNYQTAVVYGGYIYTSSNYGNTWVAKATEYGNKKWYRVSISSDGIYQTAVVENGYIYTSSNYGNTWVAKATEYGNKYWRGISISWNGKYQTAVSNYIYSSNNFGNSWTQRTSDVARNWYDVSISSSGYIQAAVEYSGRVYISQNYGNGWGAKSASYSTNNTWTNISVSSTGQYIIAIDDGSSFIYISNNYGNNNSWSLTNSIITRIGSWCTCVSISANSRYITVGSSKDRIYVSRIDSNLSINVNPVSLILDSSNNIYLSGTYDGNLKFYDNKNINFNILTNDIGIDAFVVKYNSDGSGIWVNKLSGIANTYPAILRIDSLEQLYVSGTYSEGGLILYNTNPNIYRFASLYDIGVFVSKYDKNGTGIWATNIASASASASASISNILLDKTLL